jgi:ssRNA-specific RNase YbeY (16S rRNA maturation enzyme)
MRSKERTCESKSKIVHVHVHIHLHLHGHVHVDVDVNVDVLDRNKDDNIFCCWLFINTGIH